MKNIESEISLLLRPATLQWREHALHEDRGFSECVCFDNKLCGDCADLQILEFYQYHYVGAVKTKEHHVFERAKTGKQL